MKTLQCCLLSLAALAGPQMTIAAGIDWPGQARAAVSLSYDDALASQLDNAVPVLNAKGIRASFYPTLSSPVLAERMAEWRALPQAGHELGNHSLFHPCSASKPNRQWVKPSNDIDQRTVEQMEQEVLTANAFLKALDGQTERTYTPPCLDIMVKDGNYLEAIEDEFVAIKGNERSLPADQVHYLLPDGLSGRELIQFVKNSAKSGGVVNIIFHGIGGDHMSVAPKDHAELIEFLAQNREVYWADTYMNIMRHVNKAVGVEKSNPGG